MSNPVTLFGLIGFPLDHSWSAVYFNGKFRSEGMAGFEYRLFPLETIEEFPHLTERYGHLAGLNVTIPYKEQVIPFLNKLDETARVIGAVNVVRITRKEGAVHTEGFNTDAPAFFETLPCDIPGKALILGTGGAAKAVAWALKKRGITFQNVSREKTGPRILAYRDLTEDIMESHRLIINATPRGMYPAIEDAPPLPYQFLSAGHLLYDLVYNPGETVFLRKGREMQARTMNGEQMLTRQAELSWDIFRLPD